MRKESNNVNALNDYIREFGAPRTLVSDNAQSEVGKKWTTILREFCIKGRTSEPHNQHQNPAEPEWGRLSKMTQNCLRVFKAPTTLSNWCLLWCCQVNNHCSRRSLNYKTPEEVATGWTPDISKFRFHFYEPLWMFEPKLKTPKDNLLKARFLAIADSCGDAMTYYVLTEPTSTKVKRQVLMRSVVKTRRKHIGKTTEYVNDDSSMENFTLSLSESMRNQQDIRSTEDVPLLLPGEKLSDPFNNNKNDDEEDSAESEEDETEVEETEMDETEEQLPAVLDSTNDAESAHAIMEAIDPNISNDITFHKILDHGTKDGILILKARYYDTAGKPYIIDTPFAKLKTDEPIRCAKC